MDAVGGMTRVPEQLVEIVDAPSGLRAFLVIDDTTLGPAAGGVRTRSYETETAARDDARALARAMTLKCALANLAAGGGKCVVMDHPGLDRARAFAVLGRAVESLAGRFRTAADLGTTDADLSVMARHTGYVHRGVGLADAVGRGLLRCAQAAAVAAGWSGLGGRHVVVQGAGSIGAAAARALAGAGARLSISDLDQARAAELANALGAEVVPVSRALSTPCDVLAPCAVGGIITAEVARELQARILCGAANNILADAQVAEVLRARGIVHVPDLIASAGAVIDGIGRSVMGLADPTPLIDALGDTTRSVLAEAAARGTTSEAVAVALAERRIAAARPGSAATL